MSEPSIINEAPIEGVNVPITKYATCVRVSMGLRDGPAGTPGVIIPGTNTYDFHLSSSWVTEKWIGDVWIGNEYLADDHVNLSEIIFDEEVQQLIYLMREISLRLRKGTLTINKPVSDETSERPEDPPVA